VWPISLPFDALRRLPPLAGIDPGTPGFGAALFNPDGHDLLIDEPTRR
jgi:hypothetical protein